MHRPARKNSSGGTSGESKMILNGLRKLVDGWRWSWKEAGVSADPSVDVDTLIVAGVASLMSIGAWISSHRSRREQTKLNRERIEEEAFVRIQGMYTSLMSIQEEQLKIANARIIEQNKKIHDLEQLNDTLRNRGPP
jgi:hypothetical protein